MSEHMDVTHHDVVTDEGPGMGLIVGIIIGVVVVLLLLWFLWLSPVYFSGPTVIQTPGATQPAPTAPAPNVTVPAPNVNVQGGSGGQGGTGGTGGTGTGGTGTGGTAVVPTSQPTTP